MISPSPVLEKPTTTAAYVTLELECRVKPNLKREPKSLLQANITIDHRSQITDHRKRRNRSQKRAIRLHPWITCRPGGTVVVDVGALGIKFT